MQSGYLFVNVKEIIINNKTTINGNVCELVWTYERIHVCCTYTQKPLGRF